MPRRAESASKRAALPQSNFRGATSHDVPQSGVWWLREWRCRCLKAAALCLKAEFCAPKRGSRSGRFWPNFPRFCLSRVRSGSHDLLRMPRRAEPAAASKRKSLPQSRILLCPKAKSWLKTAVPPQNFVPQSRRHSASKRKSLPQILRKSHVSLGRYRAKVATPRRFPHCLKLGRLKNPCLKGIPHCLKAEILRR